MVYFRTTTKEVLLTQQLFKYNNQYSQSLKQFDQKLHVIKRNITILGLDAV